MRKHYALAGIVVAVMVAALIVVAGSHSSGTAGSTTGTSGSTSLPPGHPAVAPSSSARPDYAKMIAALEAKYGKHPDDIKTALSLADAYLMNEQTAKASALYAKVLAREPSNQTAKVQYAMALHASGNDTKALELLNDAIKANPDDQLAHYNLAILYFSRQQSSLAKAEWQKAAAIDPTSSLGAAAQNFVDLMQNSTGAPHPATSP